MGTNMPIKRFTDFLHRRGEFAEYMDLLVRNFNPDTVKELMCLDTINIGWDGKIYDCDFNQQLGYAVGVDSIHKGADVSEIPQWLIGGFGAAVVSSVTYFTLSES